MIKLLFQLFAKAPVASLPVASLPVASLPVAEPVDPVEDALARTDEYIARHGWHLAKEMDEFYGSDSGVGEVPLKYSKGGRGLPQGNATENFVDMVGNSLNMLHQSIYIAMQEFSGGDLVKALARVRAEDFMDYSDYSQKLREDPDLAISANQSHKYAIARLAFDKFVEELGGHALKLAVQREAVNISLHEGMEIVK